MKLPSAACPLEDALLARANALPLVDAQVSRTDHGALCICWKAPSEDIGGLWLYVHECEITLGTKSFHTHHSRIDYYPEILTDDELYERIVEDAIKEALAIMGGEKVFSTSYDREGKPTSYGMRPLIQSDEAKEHDREFKQKFPDRYASERQWTWFGEISV